MSASGFTEKDQDDLGVVLAHHVDYVALSFVRNSEDMIQLKERIRSLGKDVPVIAKIERPEAVNTLDQILHRTEGVMIARGDLAIEMSPEDIPVLAETHYRLSEFPWEVRDYRHSNVRVHDHPSGTNPSRDHRCSERGI